MTLADTRMLGPARPAPPLAIFEAAATYGAIFTVIFLLVYPAYILWLDDYLIEPSHFRNVLGVDFINIWTGGKLAMSHQLDLLPHIEAYDAAQRVLLGVPEMPEKNWSYPPTLLPFCIPFALLPYHLALALWNLGGWLAFCAATLWGHDRRTAITGALVLSPIILVNTFFGQNGLYTAALAIGAFRLIDKRPVIAGLLLALLTLKPHLGIMLGLMLLIERQWLAMAVAAGVSAAMVAVSLVLFGTQPWVDWITIIVPLQESFTHPRDDFAVSTLMMPSILIAFRLIGAPEWFALLLHGAGALFAIGCTLVAYRQCDRLTARATGIMATMAISPYLFFYDFGALTGMLWLVLLHRPNIREDKARFLLLCFYLPILPYFLTCLTRTIQLHVSPAFPNLSLTPILVLCLLGWMVRHGLPTRVGGPTPVDPRGAQAATT